MKGCMHPVLCAAAGVVFFAGLTIGAAANQQGPTAIIDVSNDSGRTFGPPLSQQPYKPEGIMLGIIDTTTRAVRLVRFRVVGLSCLPPQGPRTE